MVESVPVIERTFNNKGPELAGVLQSISFWHEIMVIPAIARKMYRDLFIMQVIIFQVRS
jgi:hypothetical protein